MTIQLRDRLSLFVSNTHAMKSDFIWQNRLIQRLAALLYAAQDKPADCASIRVCYELIKQNTGLFSAFRGNSAIAIAAMLSLSDHREQLLGDTLAVYADMRGMKFWSSDYLAIAAFQVAANTTPDSRRVAMDRAYLFFDGMRQRHKFITGQDDYAFAAMLGVSDVDVTTGLERIEELYRRLKPEFSSSNSVQTLTQVLVLGGETEQTLNQLFALREAFKAQRLRLDREYTLPALGVLALLPDEVDSIASDVAESYDILREKKGFGMWSISKQELLMLASGLVAFTYADALKNGIMNTALSTTITSIIIAEQVMMAAIAASSASAASSSSFSS